MYEIYIVSTWILMGREKNERHIYTRILADLQSCFLYTMYAGLCSLIANLMPFVFGPISHNFQPGIFWSIFDHVSRLCRLWSSLVWNSNFFGNGNLHLKQTSERLTILVFKQFLNKDFFLILWKQYNLKLRKTKLTYALAEAVNGCHVHYLKANKVFRQYHLPLHFDLIFK